MRPGRGEGETRTVSLLALQVLATPVAGVTEHSITHSSTKSHDWLQCATHYESKQYSDHDVYTQYVYTYIHNHMYFVHACMNICKYICM